MRLRLFFLLSIIPLICNAQIYKTDFKQIKRNLFDDKSGFSREKLVFKYKVYPKSLDSLEGVHLYYGRNFLGDNILTTDKEFMELANYYNNKDFAKCIELGKKLYNKDPTNLDILLILLKGYDEAKNSKDLLHHLNQFRLLTDAMKSSGDGKTEKTAYLVNSVGDEYIFLNMLNLGEGYTRKSKTLKDGVLDIWEKEEEKIYIKVLYIR